MTFGNSCIMCEGIVTRLKILSESLKKKKNILNILLSSNRIAPLWLLTKCQMQNSAFQFGFGLMPPALVGKKRRKKERLNSFVECMLNRCFVFGLSSVTNSE